MRYPWGLETATCETLRSSLREAAAVEEAESVARGVEEVPDVVERPLLGAEEEDGAALRLLRQPRRVPQWQLRRVQRPQDLPVQRQCWWRVSPGRRTLQQHKHPIRVVIFSLFNVPHQ